MTTPTASPHLILVMPPLKVLAQLPTNQNLTVSYYHLRSRCPSRDQPHPDITKHRNTANPTTQNIYARVDSNDVNACLGLGHHITLKVDPFPESNTITDYILCSDTTQATFDLTTKDRTHRQSNHPHPDQLTT